MMRSPTLDQLSSVLAEAGRLIAGIRPEQWTARTPCEDWDVRALVAHLVTGNLLFVAALRGSASSPSHDDDPVTAFGQSANELIAAFGEPDALQRTVQVPFGTVPGVVALHLRVTEILVHGWDVARATHQSPLFDPAVAEQELEFSEAALAQLPSDRTPFGPPTQPPSDASAVERLCALLGRNVTRVGG